jgi:ribosomal protein S18 acetylase RimI-like enzyme
VGVAIEPFSHVDVDELVPIHRDAFQGYMNARLGTGYTAAFLRWFPRHPRDTIRLVARDEASKEALGYVVGVTREEEAILVKSLVPYAIAGLLCRPSLVLDREIRTKVIGRLAAMAGRESPEAATLVLPPPTMGLIAIGVASAARGREVGSQLMGAFEAEARKMRMSSVFLSVYSENTAARRLYERCGWSIPPGDHFGGRAYYYAKVLLPDGSM